MILLNRAHLDRRSALFRSPHRTNRAAGAPARPGPPSAPLILHKMSVDTYFSGGVVPVESPDIASLTLCVPLPLAARVYIGPWLLAYPLAAYAFYGAYDHYIQSIGKSLAHSHVPLEARFWREAGLSGEGLRLGAVVDTEWTFLLCILLFGGHALSFLFTRWSVSFRSRGEARHVTNTSA